MINNAEHMDSGWMDPNLTHHNIHLDGGLEAFRTTDPHLRRLYQQKLIFKSSLLEKPPQNMPGIYSLTGARQIGKTTLLKQWMEKLMSGGLSPSQFLFLTGEVIDDHHALVRIVSEVTNPKETNKIFYLVIDEVTYIKDWDKGIKFLADSGQLENTVLILCGSDLSLIKEARKRFPGRRGKSECLDFHLFPLSFNEAVGLKQKQLDLESDHFIDLLFDEFQQYLQHGGFLTAMNELSKENTITQGTFATYSDWIRGDLLKRGKQETYLREIFFGIIKNYGCQMSWNALSKHLSIDHPMTVASYVDLLSHMDVLLVQQPLMEDKLKGAPKKAKKIFFTDPFIYHAIFHWLYPQKNPFENNVQSALTNPTLLGSLVESVVVLSSKDLKQVLKYKNAKIWGQVREKSSVHHVEVEPLPLALWRLTGENP